MATVASVKVITRREDAATKFREWVREIDRVITGRIGTSAHDLPDQPLRDLFDDGTLSDPFTKLILRRKP